MPKNATNSIVTISDNYQPPSNNIATTQITLNANHASNMLATC